MRIALTSPAWPGGSAANGITTAVAYLAQGLRDAGHETTIISFTQSEVDKMVIDLPLPSRRSLGARVIARISSRAMAEQNASSFADRIASAALRAMRERGAEALIMEETQGWAGLVQRKLPIPVIVTLHCPWFIHRELAPNGTDVPINLGREGRERDAVHSCAGVLAPSSDVMDRTIARYGMPQCPTAVIPNPMPASHPLDHAALSDAERRSILFVGRYEPVKGGDLILEAFTELLRRGVDSRLTFVGPDTGFFLPDGRRQGIEEAIAMLPTPVRERIDYKGLVPKASIAELRLRHGVTAIASRYENLNYSMLEALAAGSAIVSTAVGGPKETLRNGETGLLVAPESPVALADGLQRVVEDPFLAARLGKAAHEELRGRFNPGRVAGTIVDFIAKVLEHRRSAA